MGRSRGGLTTQIHAFVDAEGLAERFFNKRRHFRTVATRYDKRDDNVLASVQLASIGIWLRR
jgi:hypothetical protein